MAALHTLSPIGRHPCSHVAQAPVRSGASRLGSGVCARMSSHLGMSIREAVKMWSRASARAHLPCVRASLRMLSDHAKRAWSESICMSTRLPRRHRPGRPGATSLESASTTRHFECALPRPRPPQSRASAAPAAAPSICCPYLSISSASKNGVLFIPFLLFSSLLCFSSSLLFLGSLCLLAQKCLCSGAQRPRLSCVPPRPRRAAGGCLPRRGA